MYNMIFHSDSELHIMVLKSIKSGDFVGVLLYLCLQMHYHY